MKARRVCGCAWLLFVVFAVSSASAQGAPTATPQPPDVWAPRVVATHPGDESDVVVLPDGTIAYFFTDYEVDEQVKSMRSSDGGRTWSEPRVEFDTERTHHACEVLLDRDGELHAFYLNKRGKGRPNKGYHIDVLHRRTTDGRTRWTDPVAAFEGGYVGSVRGSLQLPSGRLLVAYAAWEDPAAPYADHVGTNASTVSYSDDGGRTWTMSPARLTAPVFPQHNTSGYGAIEPAIIRLDDGRAWMVIRTQTDYLFESYSEDGVEWSPAVATRFASSSSPAAVLRLRDDRLVLLWNQCGMPPRVDGQLVYGGRDAIHAAISDDEGETWRGFREIYLDPTRHDSPPERHDRGTAYLNAVETPEGNVLAVTGQGDRGQRGMVLFHPDWLLEDERESSVTPELDGWSVFSEFGPAARAWRDRRQGAEVIAHPDEPGRYALHVRHPTDLPSDAAVWNFPMAEKGELTLRVMRQEGAGPLKIALLDRFLNPSDPTADEQSPYLVVIGAEGQMVVGGPAIGVGEWTELTLRWDAARRACRVSVGDTFVTTLPLRRDVPFGVNYLRIADGNPSASDAGWLVEDVQMERTNREQRKLIDE